MLSGIAEGRGISQAEAQEQIDRGPYTPGEAMDVRLVDDLAYSDQLEEISKQITGKKVEKLSGKQYIKRRYYNYDWGAKPKIAVIYATGMIAPGKSISSEEALFFPEIMGSDTIMAAVKKAREDKSVKAIVLRIDSGGGSVFASDLIWREISLTKGKKPLVVSMGDIAASGGYYIACPADAIVAEPGTITGSIGVIAGKFNLRGFYDKLGIKKDILKKGKNSDIYTAYSGFTDEQREIADRQMQELYQDFVRKVAKGRNMEESAVESVAQGRVWTGSQAKGRGLVDELGGLQLAMSIAQEKAGLRKDESVDVVILPERVSLLRRFIFQESSLFSNAKYLMDAIVGILAYERIFFLIPYAVDYE